MAESHGFRWILYTVAIPAGALGTAILLSMTTLAVGWPFHEAEGLHLVIRVSCRADCALEEEADCREQCDCFADELRRGHSDDEYAALIRSEDEEQRLALYEEIAELCAVPLGGS